MMLLPIPLTPPSTAPGFRCGYGSWRPRVALELEGREPSSTAMRPPRPRRLVEADESYVGAPHDERSQGDRQNRLCA